MNEEIRIRLKKTVADYRLPRYAELPNEGIYLEQVTKYVNGFLVPIGCAEITTSMISNYVKKGIIPPPEKKQYYADHIAHLMFVAVAKNVLSLDNIHELFLMQRQMYSVSVAYDYYCMEFENMLTYVFGVKEKPDANIGVTHTELKDFLRNVIISVSHSVYLAACFDEIKREKDPDR